MNFPAGKIRRNLDGKVMIRNNDEGGRFRPSGVLTRMKITAQEEYGLRCLLRLARVGGPAAADHPGDRGGGGAVRPVRGQVVVGAAAGRSDRERPRLRPAAIGWPARRPRSAWAPCCWPWASRCSTSRLLRPPRRPRNRRPLRPPRRLHPPRPVETLEGWIRRTLNQITLADLLESEGRIADLLRDALADGGVRAGRDADYAERPAPK